MATIRKKRTKGGRAMMMYVPVLLIAGVLLLFVWVFWQTNQFKGYVNNAVLCTFITAHGTSYDKVLPLKGEIIMPPSGKWMKKKDKLKDWGEYKLPKKTFTCMYPLGGWPAPMKVEVKRVFMLETDANTFEALDAGPHSGLTPQAFRAARNPAIAASLLKPDGEVMKGALAGGGGKNTKYTFYLQLVTVGLIIILGVLMYLTFSALSGHITAWGA